MFVPIAVKRIILNLMRKLLHDIVKNVNIQFGTKNEKFL